MIRTVLLGVIAASFCRAAPASGAEPDSGLARHSLSQLEQRLAKIDVDLKGLAHMSLNSGVGPIGYRSTDYPDADHAEWVEIDLGREGPVDEIVLVPAIWRSGGKGFVSDAFPAAFRVVVGTGDDRTGSVVADFPDTRGLFPRIAPLIVPVSGRRASWVRIEATRLSPRAWDGRYIFQLSEVLVFRGEENIALHKAVKVSACNMSDSAWKPEFLVDGILPYVMNAAEGKQSLAFVSGSDLGKRPAIMIDLQQDTRVSGLRLHAADQSDTVPQAFAGDFGLPRRFLLEGAVKPDYSDSKVLLEADLSSIYRSGPIMAWNFEEAPCRYLRLTVLEPYDSQETGLFGTRIGFAEIEVLSKGLNVAVGKRVRATFEANDPSRLLTALTDGRNLYGTILPLRRWLGELARRHDLELERPLIEAELTRRYALQKTYLARMIWVATLLAAGIGFLLLYYRLHGQRQEARIRRRIAANLHDELGANLHAIGLLGDLAKDAVDSREDLIDTVDRIRSLAERTGSAARNCANMLEAKGVCEDLVAEMQRDSRRLLADLKHEMSVEGKEALRLLTRRKRIDLYLFYKETLVNVIRHSGATKVVTRLVADPRQVLLTVSDDGIGFTGAPPASLTRRARLLRADFQVQHPESGGIRIVLKLRTRKFPSL